MKKTRKLGITIAVLVLLYGLAVLIVPRELDRRANKIVTPPPYTVSEKAQALYDSLDFIADLHCDALLWSRDLTKRNTVGHVDFPRMEDAHMALQAFTIVTKSPAGQNFSRNSADAFDNITLLNILQARPIPDWFSMFGRAEYQCRRLHRFSEAYGHPFKIIRNKSDLEHLIALRKTDPKAMGGFLGVEGGHCLEGDLANLDLLFEEGVRMLGPTHFFDNELGGSAHGESGEGLTEFGRSVVQRMNALGMIIDLAHASPVLIDDVLALSKKPVLVSHTGVKGTRDNSRNLSDAHVRQIAEKGGLIGVGFFKGAIKSPLVPGIVDAMKYIRKIAGVQCIALGSDFDGSATTPFDITGLPLLVEALMGADFNDDEIKAIMGGNVKRFMLDNLPGNP